MKKLIITLIIVAIVVLGGIYGFFKNQIQAVDSSSHGIKIVNIKTGSGTDEIASQLKKENLIKNETVVIRNYLKRRLKEIIRHHFQLIPKGYNVIIYSDRKSVV